jgi:probable phosphoglycerate mutase
MVTMSPQPEPAAPTTLLLIRHGETEWNAQARIQGHRDTPLSERGLRQAQVLARHLVGGADGAALAAVISSDLARARQTAEPLAQRLGLALRQDARLRERAFGLFEGHTYAEAEARWPNEYAIWRQRDPAYAVPGGESYLDTRARVLACLEDIVRAHPARTVAIVTHGGVLDAVYRAAEAIPWETARSHLLPNASINRVLARLVYGAPMQGGMRLALTVQAWAERGHLDAALDEIG